MRKSKKPELLAPAGDLENLKIAVTYGADAVYIGGERFGLRAKARNFNPEQMAQGIEFAHAHHAKVYVTANIFAFDEDLEGMRGYFPVLADMGVDALIVSDPGVFRLAKEVVPNMDIHISTQANTTNSGSVRFWHDLGASRVILARELTLESIRSLSAQKPASMELEVFVHGAMCIAYSGRCLLSHYMTGRSANRGECAQPCRYSFHVMEETRPGQYLPIEEDHNGVTVFSANDLCMVQHLPELLDAGVNGLKIEGRMKTPFYVGVTVKTYREALDDLWDDPERYAEKRDFYKTSLKKASHRGMPDYSTGFYFGQPDAASQTYAGEPHTRTHEFLGIVLAYDDEKGIATVEQRNKISVGDVMEVVQPCGEGFSQTITEMCDAEGNPLDSAPHSRQIVKIVMQKPVAPLDMVCAARSVQ